MRVYVGERTAQHFKLWLVEQRPAIDASEVAEVLRELDEQSAVADVRGGGIDEAARRAAVAQKNDLLSRFRAAQEAPKPRVLFERSAHVDFSRDEVASAVLTAELGVQPTEIVARQFAADLLHTATMDDVRIPSSRVHDWLLERRDLVERELFVEPPGRALSVAPTDGRTDRSTGAEPPSPATASAFVAACEAAWTGIQEHHPELPDAVIVLGSGVERGRLVKLGHWWGGRWIADGQVRGEVLIAGEALHLEPNQVFEVLLHEAAHGLNAARGIKDTSRGGRYHNQRYAEAAREVLLRVRPMTPYGMADTRLSDGALERYETTITQLADTMRIARQLERDTLKSGTEQELGGGVESEGRGRGSGSNVVAACGCGRRLRMAPTVLSAGPVVCGLCDGQFVVTTERVRARDPERSNDVVDNTFVARRRAALSSDGSVGTVSTGSVEMLANQRDRLAAVIDADVGDASLVTPLAERRARLEALIGPSAASERPAQEQLEGVREFASVRPTVRESIELTRWYERFGTLDERPMTAGDPANAARRERLARALLKADGSLRGPEVAVGQLALMTGDRVTTTADAGDDHPPPGTPGTVVAVNGRNRTVDIDFATWGRLRASLESRLSAPFRYDYTEPGPPQPVDPRLEIDRIVPEVEP